MAKQLAIEISLNSFRFALLDGERVTDSCQGDFDLHAEENEKKEILAHQFNTHPFLQSDFDEVTLSWSHQKSTLVPNVVFAETTPEEVFRLCFGTGNAVGEVDYNRISELSIVNIYEIPTWIKRFFVIKFPRIILQHEGSHVLRKSTGSDSFKLKATMVVYDSSFLLTIVKHNQLEFYSYFDFQSHEDIVYHLLFTLQQKELTKEKGSIDLIAGRDANMDILPLFISAQSRIAELNSFEINTPENYIPHSQLLCV